MQWAKQGKHFKKQKQQLLKQFINQFTKYQQDSNLNRRKGKKGNDEFVRPRLNIKQKNGPLNNQHSSYVVTWLPLDYDSQHQHNQVEGESLFQATDYEHQYLCP